MKTYTKPHLEVSEVGNIGLLMASPATSVPVSFGGTATDLTGD